jgi:hypothetical protein
MADAFAAIHESVNAQMESDSQANKEERLETQDSGASHESHSDSQEQADITDLEKIEKFMFQGKEYTYQQLAKELKAKEEAQRSYTQNQQALAETRKNLETAQGERKYYENLVYDLEKVKRDPALAQEFVKVYPERFHSYLKDILQGTSNSESLNQVQPQVPVELLSRVEQLNQYVQQQEVAKAEVQIEQDLTKALSQFKYASRKEVLADVYEFHNQLPVDPSTGRKPAISNDIWLRAAEASHNERLESYKAYQKDMQQQQKQANSKARDVGAGGGTLGQAPKKFDPKKGFSALNKEVLGQFTGKP